MESSIEAYKAFKEDNCLFNKDTRTICILDKEEDAEALNGVLLAKFNVDNAELVELINKFEAVCCSIGAEQKPKDILKNLALSAKIASIDSLDNTILGMKIGSEIQFKSIPFEYPFTQSDINFKHQEKQKLMKLALIDYCDSLETSGKLSHMVTDKRFLAELYTERTNLPPEVVLDELDRLEKSEDNGAYFNKLSNLTRKFFQPDEVEKADAISLSVIPEERRNEYLAAGITEETILYCLENGWKAEDVTKGYIPCVGYSEMDIPDAIQIQSLGDLGFYENDSDAREQAVKDGVAFINDISDLEKEVYIDTPENRKICIEALEQNPELRIGNLLNSQSDEFQNWYISKYGEPKGYRSEKSGIREVQEPKKLAMDMLDGMANSGYSIEDVQKYMADLQGVVKNIMFKEPDIHKRLKENENKSKGKESSYGQ